jgi:hypothetical protein
MPGLKLKSALLFFHHNLMIRIHSGITSTVNYSLWKNMPADDFATNLFLVFTWAVPFGWTLYTGKRWFKNAKLLGQYSLGSV